jgi:hypothetical protein
MSLALPTVPQTSWRRTAPDLGLIKQVKQDNWPAVAGIQSAGSEDGRGSGIFNLIII